MIYKNLENGDLEFNVSSNLPNYSQRNNEYIDEITNKKIACNMCNVTSYCMAYSYTGGAFPPIGSSKYSQEEDRFLEFLRNSKDVLNYYKNLNLAYYNSWKNNEKDCYPPEQIHDVLNYAFNLWVGWKSATFIPNASIDSMIKEIITNNKPMVVSGKFGKLNHIVVLTGVVVDKEAINNINSVNLLKFVKSFIIDDPYGDFRTEYSSYKGNDVRMTSEQFLSIFKPVDNRLNKMCHFFHSPLATA